MKPLAISHRGVHEPYEKQVENTIPAFLRAVKLGATGIELDVHATRDGVIIVYHDSHLPDGRAVKDVDYASLKDIRLGADAGIPSLEEVFDAVRDTATIYIEAKARNIEQPLVDCLKKIKGDFCVHSFDHPAVLNIKRLYPSVRAGILQVSRLVDAVSAMRAADATDLWQHHDYIDRELVDEVHAAGGRVIAWTPNTPEAWSTLEGYGIDGICTDNILELMS